MNKLYRSNNQVMIAGVCGGIAEYFNIDATLVRLVFAMFCVFAGSGILIYILAWIIIPKSPF